MGLLSKFAFWSAAGAAGYSLWQSMKGNGRAAFAHGEAGPEGSNQVRNAGPDAMRDGAKRPWKREDEESDESFPASDPPANY